MNEQEWQTTNDARAMLRYLRGQPETHRSRWFAWIGTGPSSLSFRKAILFICGSIRDQGGLIWGQPPHNKLLEFCEDWADSPDPTDVAALRRAYPPLLAAKAFDLLQPTRTVSADALMLHWLPDSRDTQRHADLLRELFGDPFQSCVFEPGWLQARDELVTKVCRICTNDTPWTNSPSWRMHWKTSAARSPSCSIICVTLATTGAAAGHSIWSWVSTDGIAVATNLSDISSREE